MLPYLVFVLTRNDSKFFIKSIPVIVAFIAVLSQFVFRLIYFHSILPNTYYAKVAENINLRHGFNDYIISYLLTIAPVGLLYLTLFFSFFSSNSRKSYFIMQSITIGYALYISYIRGDWMTGYRFLVPWIPFMIISVLQGLAVVLFFSKILRNIIIVCLTLFILFTQPIIGFKRIYQITGRRTSKLFWKNMSFKPETYIPYYALSQWIIKAIKPESTICASEAGAIPFITEMRNIDTWGLCDYDIARLPRGSVTRNRLGVVVSFREKVGDDPVLKIVVDKNPDMILLRRQEKRRTILDNKYEFAFEKKFSILDVYFRVGSKNILVEKEVNKFLDIKSVSHSPVTKWSCNPFLGGKCTLASSGKAHYSIILENPIVLKGISIAYAGSDYVIRDDQTITIKILDEKDEWKIFDKLVRTNIAFTKIGPDGNPLQSIPTYKKEMQAQLIKGVGIELTGNGWFELGAIELIF